MVNSLEKWIWSSYLDYIGKREGTPCNKNSLLNGMNSKEYEKFVLEDIKRSVAMKEYKRMLDKFQNLE